MAFDLEHWKTQVYIRYQKLKDGLNRESAAQLYAFLSVTALWPVLEAAQRGDWSAAVTLASLTAAGLGTNLLANQIQGWKDQTSAIQQINEAARQDPALRAELDLVLEKVEAISLAEKSLNEADRAWFAETLQKELAHLNSGLSYTATLTGSGAIAQGPGAKAVGAGGVLIEGSLNGDLNLRNVRAQNYIENQVVNPLPPDPAAEKRQQAREAYLTRLRRHCQALPLAAMGGAEGVESEITLDKVYIELDTTTAKEKRKENLGLEAYQQEPEYFGVREDSPPLSALEAASQHQHLVLLGDPGAGKSTFVKKILGWQAAACQGQAQPPAGFAPSLLPVLVNLRDLAPRLAEIDLAHLPAHQRDEKLRQAVDEQLLADLGHDCTAFASAVQENLRAGTCLLVLDGLDEVPQVLRGHVRLAVDALLKQYRLQRVIVTCRVRSYVGETVLPQFTSHTLAPFRPEQIQNFVTAWYQTQCDLGHLTREQAEARAADLAAAASQADLRELSSNPMLLTTMAIIHQREVGLPRERVRLYSLAVEVLLRRWQKHKVGDAALAEFLKDDLKLRAVLEALAYAAHRASTGAGGAGTLLRKDALDLLEQPQNLGELRLAGEFLDYVDQRAGLLVGYGGELHKPTAYSFPHRTFQEYLAGAYLAGQRDRVRTFLAHAAEGDGWDLAAQLAFEELFYNRRGANDLLDLAYQLGAAFKPGEQPERAFLWAGQITALVGRPAVEQDSHPAGGPAFLEKLLPGLVNLLAGSLPPLERAEAGRALGKLGDPRPEVLVCEQMAFCHVPAGEFLFGEGKKQKKIELDEYWIGKYPVTNAQFAQFVEAGGYAEARLWEEAKKAKIWRKGKIHLEWAKEIREAPADFGEPYNLPNHPVVGITWYEALAFTRWLSEQLPVISNQLSVNTRHDLLIEQAKSGKLQTVLPSEEQWEKAARGTDGRKYPWAGEFDPNQANTSETGLGTTSAVGAFPGGESPFGLLDASGNVREWTDSRSDNSTYVLRGGSFLNNAVNARCAYRNWYDPYGWIQLIGFRVVVVFSRASQ